MADGNSLRPGQLVDVDFRFSPIQCQGGREKVQLQTRKLTRDDHGRLTWSAWENIRFESNGEPNNE